MSFREKLQLWVREAVGEAGGSASVLDVAKHIWMNHQSELHSAGDHFYSWQYDMRWAAQRLRDQGVMDFHKVGGRSRWVLK